MVHLHSTYLICIYCAFYAQPEGEDGEPREVELAMGFEDLFSVTSSERRVHLSKKENVLEKQRIAKHQSEDS